VATYFDPTDPADLQLLPPSLRDAPVVEELAPLVEDDVIALYTRHYHDARYTLLQPVASPPLGFTQRPSFVFTPRGFATDIGGGQLVYLIGYMPDSADAQTDVGLVKAMKREIAETLRWRAKQWDRDPGVRSEGGQSGLTRSYAESVDDPFPPSFGRWLKPYDSRPTNWAL